MESILFVASNPVFVKPIAEELSKKYNVRTDFHRNLKDSDDFTAILEDMRAADITFVDWVDPLLIEVSRGLKTCKIIARLHSYEFFDGYVEHVNWKNIDKLILVNHSLENLIKYKLPFSQKKLQVIYHGIDINKFLLPPNKTKSNVVAMAGFINYKKDPSFALACFDEIYRECPHLKFVWAGQHQDLRYHLDAINMMSKIQFPFSIIPWQEDMNKFLQGVDYMLSTSIFESCHLSLLEGMACGVVPMVRMWRGAENIYPSHSLFIMPHDVAHRIAAIESGNLFGVSREEFLQLNRNYIEKYYSFTREVEEIDQLIQEVLHNGKN